MGSLMPHGKCNAAITTTVNPNATIFHMTPPSKALLEDAVGLRTGTCVSLPVAADAVGELPVDVAEGVAVAEGAEVRVFEETAVATDPGVAVTVPETVAEA